MTSAEAINRIRGLLNQYGVTTGFHSDTVLYKYLDSAQLEVITLGKAKQDFIQKTDKGYEFLPLQVLIKADSTTALATNTVEYNLPADFMFTYSMQLDIDNSATKYKATLLPYNEFLWKEDNYFARAIAKNPRYYVRLTKFGVAPTPSANGSYLHYYYYKPTEITGSGTAITLRDESHNAMIWFALSYALEQEARAQESLQARNTAINLIKDL